MTLKSNINGDKLKEKYRKDLYIDYASTFKNNTGSFDFDAADRFLPCLQYYLREWLPTDRSAQILDLGCGDGRVIYCLGKLGYDNVKGVDISDSQVALAEQITSNVEKRDVLEYLESAQEDFGLMVSFDVIEHLGKNEVLKFLEGCYTRLGSGGRLVIQTPNATSPFFGAVRYGDLTHELAFTPTVLGQLMKRAGFTSVHSREMPPVPRGYSLKSSLRFLAWQFIRTFFGLVDSVETGGRGTAIYTRVFVISGIK